MTAVWVIHVSDPDVAAQVRAKAAIAIGWPELGDLSVLTSREDLLERVRFAYPDDKPMRQAMSAGQLFRFAREIAEGDLLITPIKSTRTILIGSFRDIYRFNPGLFGAEYPHTRQVEWLKEVSRDDFSVPARNTLGGLATVFRADSHIKEIEALRAGTTSTETVFEEGAVADLYSDVKAKADEAIRDIFARLSGYEFQELLAALLRAMGYVAKVGPRGKDVGVDVLAHPDPFGFSDPRIKVQVKHRSGQATRPELQAFSGVLNQREHGLFVSTGGFTKDAESWVNQAGRGITLMDGEGFVELFLANYEKLDSGVKAIVPLRPVWIPVTP